ncbi:MAG: bifunctional phosphoglucose/phosphomannose isomerase [Chloroflexi bacterium]|nr:bifunctional phosphoglucose/phosphomannose isomerase [Chloroflexota bacterium]
MNMLDDPKELSRIDPTGFLRCTHGLPGQVREAVKLGRSLEVEPEEFRSIVMLGMGGSAIGGELLSSCFKNSARVPLTVVRDYEVPAFVGEGSLVLTVSYSGNTEESLSSYRQARDRGAAMVTFSSGGILAEEAKKTGHPHLILPGGLAPRAAIAYTFFPPALLLSGMGILPDISADIEETCKILDELSDEWSPDRPVDVNLPKKTAENLWGRIPVIYGAGPQGAVAYRWKCQINENARLHAFSHTLPEMNHNEIMGWAHPDTDYRKFAPVLLRGAEHPRNALRSDILRKILEEKTGALEFEGEGNSLLSRLFSLIYLGDLTSVYMAILGGIDPLPVRLIEDFKKELARHPINSTCCKEN